MNNKRSSFKCAEDFIKKSSFSNLSNPFKHPEKKRKLETIEEKTPEQTQDFEETLTEELPIDAEAAESSGEESGEFIDEAIVREEIQKWLEENGSAFFHVESTKFLAKEKKLASKKVSKK
jgi:recombination DNA repair RAD52 pathway protein